MERIVKMTVRLPAGLHEQLKKRAKTSDWSLNTVVVETLREGLEQEKPASGSERDRVLRLLREYGLIEELGPGWKKTIEQAPKISHAELRERLKGVPPLSELIIAEREPR